MSCFLWTTVHYQYHVVPRNTSATAPDFTLLPVPRCTTEHISNSTRLHSTLPVPRCTTEHVGNSTRLHSTLPVPRCTTEHIGNSARLHSTTSTTLYHGTHRQQHQTSLYTTSTTLYHGTHQQQHQTSLYYQYHVVTWSTSATAPDFTLLPVPRCTTEHISNSTRLLSTTSTTL